MKTKVNDESLLKDINFTIENKEIDNTHICIHSNDIKEIDIYANKAINKKNFIA